MLFWVGGWYAWYCGGYAEASSALGSRRGDPVVLEPQLSLFVRSWLGVVPMVIIDFRLLCEALPGLGVDSAPGTQVADAGRRGGGIPSYFGGYSDSLSLAACDAFVPLFQLRLNFLRKEELDDGVSGVSRSWDWGCTSSLCFCCRDLSLGIGSPKTLQDDLISGTGLLSGPWP